MLYFIKILFHSNIIKFVSSSNSFLFLVCFNEIFSNQKVILLGWFLKMAIILDYFLCYAFGKYFILEVWACLLSLVRGWMIFNFFIHFILDSRCRFNEILFIHFIVFVDLVIHSLVYCEYIEFKLIISVNFVFNLILIIGFISPLSAFILVFF